MEILNSLRQATRTLHGNIEELPICKAMLASDVSHATYAKLLGELYHIHAAYESALASQTDLQRCWPNTPSRAAAIARDLKVLGYTLEETPATAQEWVSDLEALGHAAAWAGVGYVLEGSRMGSRVLVKCLAPALELKPELGHGLDYHLDAGEDPNGNWRAVMGALAAMDRSPEAHEAMVAAAVRTFEELYAIHERIEHTHPQLEPVS